jgi:hypothetical protein
LPSFPQEYSLETACFPFPPPTILPATIDISSGRKIALNGPGNPLGGKMKRNPVGIIGVMSLLVLGAFSEGGSHPGIRRKYKTTCVTCHAPFPELTALGSVPAERLQVAGR